MGNPNDVAGDKNQQTDGVVVSGVQGSGTKRRLFLLAVVVCCVVVIAGVVLAYFLVFRDQPPKGASTETVLQTKQDLDTQAYRGDFDAANKGYEQAVSDESDTKKKRTLLMSQAAMAINAQKYEEALVAAKAADALSSDYNTLGIIATIYDKMGKKQEAIDYYTKAAADKNDFNYEAKRYELRAQELRATL